MTIRWSSAIWKRNLCVTAALWLISAKSGPRSDRYLTPRRPWILAVKGARGASWAICTHFKAPHDAKLLADAGSLALWARPMGSSRAVGPAQDDKRPPLNNRSSPAAGGIVSLAARPPAADLMRDEVSDVGDS
jgi:hypothetical protein